MLSFDDETNFSKLLVPFVVNGTGERVALLDHRYGAYVCS